MRPTQIRDIEMKRLALFLVSLFLLGTIVLNAQEMTEKEKSGYALGVVLGEKLKSSEIDLSFIETLREGGFFEALRTGLQDALKGENKLSMEELQATLEALATKVEAMQNKGNQEVENGSQPVAKSASDYQSLLARNYCTVSWYSLFIKEYAQSEQSARKALELDSTYIVSKTNLAHALLFQNRFSEAETIYNELVQADETYAEVLLSDFKDLERADVIPDERKADVEKIRTNLSFLTK